MLCTYCSVVDAHHCIISRMNLSTSQQWHFVIKSTDNLRGLFRASLMKY